MGKNATTPQPPITDADAAADLAGTPRPDNPSAEATAAQAGKNIIVNTIVRLEIAQSLPEVPADAELQPVEHAEGAIERFIASDTDRRVMAIVGFAGGLAAQAVKEAPPAEA